MKTTCHCVYCPHHPLNGQSHDYRNVPRGYSPGDFPDRSSVGREVNCLDPQSDAFDYIDPEGEEFPVTAYGDGCAITGFSRPGLVVTATCGNEGFQQTESAS